MDQKNLQSYAMGTANHSSRIETIIVEKELKEEIIEHGAALYGTRDKGFNVLIATETMYTAHLIHYNRGGTTIDVWSKWEVVASGGPAVDRTACLQSLLDSVQRQLAGEIPKHVKNR